MPLDLDTLALSNHLVREVGGGQAIAYTYDGNYAALRQSIRKQSKTGASAPVLTIGCSS